MGGIGGSGIDRRRHRRGGILVRVGTDGRRRGRVGLEAGPPGRRQGGGGGKTGGKSGTAAKVMYTCAMHPAYIADKPGNCPLCGMALVPVTGHGHDGEAGAGSGRVRIDSITLSNMGARTALVEKRELAPEIRTSGKIAVDESRQVSVNARVGGYVESLRASATGKAVRKGETLLELYSPELTGAQEEYLQALRYANGLKGESGQGGGEGKDRVKDKGNRAVTPPPWSWSRARGGGWPIGAYPRIASAPWSKEDSRKGPCPWPRLRPA